VVRVAPTDPDARIKLKECEKVWKKQEFERAIASDEKPYDVLDKIGEINDIIVDSDYTGPRFEEEITAEFVTGMMDHFRDQKKLHRKYALKLMIAVCVLEANLKGKRFVDFASIAC
jgi:serine/threonine-protein phosphatase 5